MYNRLHVNITIVPALVDIYNYSIDRRAVFSSWKKARLTPIFKKDDETDSGNYKPVSLLSVPSKILEAEINDRLVNYVFEDNQLITDKQWVYRRGHSTELLLVHLTEIWRTALDSDSVVAAAFVDFRKAFDSVSHEILLKKLESNFGIRGGLPELFGRQNLIFCVKRSEIGATTCNSWYTAGIGSGSDPFLLYLLMTCHPLSVRGLSLCMLTIPQYSALDSLQMWLSPY